MASRSEVGGQEGLLGQVLGRGGVPHQLEADRVDQPLILDYQLGKDAFVSLFTPCRHLLLRPTSIIRDCGPDFFNISKNFFDTVVRLPL